MSWLTLVDPLTYAVDAMRQTIGHYRPAHHAGTLFDPVTWGGLHPAPLVELGVVAAFSVVASRSPHTGSPGRPDRAALASGLGHQPERAN